MEMADTIVINKADGDNIRKAQLAKSEFNRAIYFQQKSGWIPTTTCSAITQDGIPEFGKPSRNLSNSRKAMIILMKTLGTERILDARGYQRTMGNFYNNTEIQNLLESTKRRCKTVKYHHLQPLSYVEKYFKNKPSCYVI
jgi:LAO/AO transport system kinase